MSEADRDFLVSLNDASFENDRHRTNFVPALAAVAAVAGDVAVDAFQASAAANIAAASLAAQMALGTAANGVGNEPMDLPRMSMLNGEAFRQWDMAAGFISNIQDATYQIVEHDSAKLLLCTSGTRTWTLPASTDVWIGWQARLRNRSGNNLTLARTGSDTINGAGSSLTIATGSAILTIVCTGAASFEVA